MIMIKQLEIIKIIESMIYFGNNNEFDWIDTTVFDSFIEPIEMHKTAEEWIFIDKIAGDILDEMLAI